MVTIGADFSLTNGIIGVLVLIAIFMATIRVGNTVLELREIKKILGEMRDKMSKEDVE